MGANDTIQFRPRSPRDTGSRGAGRAAANGGRAASAGRAELARVGERRIVGTGRAAAPTSSRRGSTPLASAARVRAAGERDYGRDRGYGQERGYSRVRSHGQARGGFVPDRQPARRPGEPLVDEDGTLRGTDRLLDERAVGPVVRERRGRDSVARGGSPNRRVERASARRTADARAQAEARREARARGGRPAPNPRVRRALVAVGIVLAVLLACFYPPARSLYVSRRSNAILAAQYGAYNKTNDELSKQNDRLLTREGIEAYFEAKQRELEVPQQDAPAPEVLPDVPETAEPAAQPSADSAIDVYDLDRAYVSEMASDLQKAHIHRSREEGKPFMDERYEALVEARNHPDEQLAKLREDVDAARREFHASKEALDTLQHPCPGLLAGMHVFAKAGCNAKDPVSRMMADMTAMMLRMMIQEALAEERRRQREEAERRVYESRKNMWDAEKRLKAAEKALSDEDEREKRLKSERMQRRVEEAERRAPVRTPRSADKDTQFDA